MQRIRNLSNKYQKRLIRPLYGQTQAYPYATSLDPSLRNTDGSFRRPLAADATSGGFPIDRSADAFVLKGGLVPGTVVAKAIGDEKVLVHPGGTTAVRPFGLLANFVGGELDDIQDENFVGVWRGPDAVFELLAPAFDDTGLSTAAAAATVGDPPKLYAGPDGRLVYLSSPSNAVAVARLIEIASPSRIIIDIII